jgi:hypothetical protein
VGHGRDVKALPVRDGRYTRAREAVRWKNKIVDWYNAHLTDAFGRSIMRDTLTSKHFRQFIRKENITKVKKGNKLIFCISRRALLQKVDGGRCKILSRNY